MESGSNVSLLAAGLVVAALAILGGILYFVFSPGRSKSSLRSLMGTQDGSGNRKASPEAEDEAERIVKKGLRVKKKKKGITLAERQFQAGLFTEEDRRGFDKMRMVLPLALAPILAYVFWVLAGGEDMLLLGIIVGGAVGYQLPISILDRRIKARHEEMMYFLPLVVEQIAIGVSSSLDIGPVLQRVVSMADERDSHNPVTELIKISQQHIRSGISFEDAVTEIGILSGHTELKHTFLSLAQVAKHGGEVSRQLQELAESVSAQRETQIEGRIKKLELQATGPVGLVFAGFLVMLLAGLGLQMKDQL